MSKNSKCHWIKLYVEMLDDPKVGLLPDAVKWRWTSVLLLAGEMNEDGFLPDVNDMAWRLHTNVETLQGEMRMLAGRGLVELRLYEQDDERWFIPAFATRQAAASGTERARMSRQRAQQNNSHNEHATIVQRNVANSLHKQKQKQNTETEQQQQRAAASAAAAAAAALPSDYTEMLQRHGIDHAKTWSELAPVLLEMDDAEALVEECIAAATALKATNPVGFAINWILQGNTQPPPVRARSGANDLARQIPAEYEHVVVR